MRIAICLYGSFENLAEKYAYFYRNFIRPNLNAIIEIYIAKTYHQGININYYYTIFGHYLKNVIFVQNQIDNDNPYLYHKIRLLNHKKGLENTHNIKYDAVVLHNLDNIFVKWQIYGERIITIDDLEIGYADINENMKCRAIDMDLISPIKIDRLKRDELICYEDYYTGLNIDDFFIASSVVCDIMFDFYNNFIKYGPVVSLGNVEEDKKMINSIHSYDAYYNNIKWWLYWDIPIGHIARQLRFNLARSDIKIKQLRYIQNMAIIHHEYDL